MACPLFSAIFNKRTAIGSRTGKPSQSKPSAADIKFTSKVIAAGKVIDVAVVDHIIVSHKGHTAMRKEGCCEFEGYAGK